MVRSLWSAATGMKSEQTAVDTIANNIANVNTTGFKAQDTQFKSLLYQTLMLSLYTLAFAIPFDIASALASAISFDIAFALAFAISFV